MDEYIFLKKASGLVKAAKPFDVFIYNIGLISVGIAVTLCHYFVPSNYQGANLVGSEIISGFFMLIIALTFWFWTIAIPRTGGIYAYVTRAISPLIGFCVSFIDSFVWLFYNAFAATYLVYIGLSPALFALGVHYNNLFLKNLAVSIQNPWLLFVIGGGAILLSGLILINGLKTFFKFQKVLFLIAITGTIATIFVLMRSSSNDFLAASQLAFGKNSMEGVQKLVSPDYVYSLKMTILAAVWPLLSFVGSIFSVNMASEIQNVRKSQFIGIFGSIVVAVVLMCVLSYSLDKVVQPQIQSAIIHYSQSSGNTIPIVPYFSVLVAVLAQSPLLIILICSGFFCWAFLWLPATINYSSKALLAWSFDRLAPASIGFVHPTKFTPVNAIASVVILNLLLLLLYIFVPFFNSLILVLAAMIAWIPVMFAAIIFPYRKKELYKQSGVVNYKFMGIPMLSIVGILGLIVVITLVCFLLTDEVAAGPNINSLCTIVILILISSIWFYTFKKISLKKNIDITRAFHEIPID